MKMMIMVMMLIIYRQRTILYLFKNHYSVNLTQMSDGDEGDDDDKQTF